MRSRTGILAGASLLGISVGAILWVLGHPGASGVAWAATTAVALGPLTLRVAAELRRRDTGVDLIALLAMAGALALGEYLAGAVIAVMLSGGEALESYAGSKARRELTSLLERAPRSAHIMADGEVVTRPVDEVSVGDRLLVKPGEIIPVDAVVSSPKAVVDESAVTGEARLVERPTGDRLASGSVNAGGPLEIVAAATAARSTYAGIVRLVREAETSKAPFVRLADRYAMLFLPVTLAAAGGAWLVTGDVVRALAVLVVATPCPLILAAPIAIVAGISRSASRGVIVKGGGALETLARARVLLFDKTGTLTAGRPSLSSVEPAANDGNEILRLAASVDQMSSHVLAASIVSAARTRGLALEIPTDVVEDPGEGIAGTLSASRVAVGKLAWVTRDPARPGWARRVSRRSSTEGSSGVFVAKDGRLAGAIVLEDRIRPDAAEALRDMRAQGIERIEMVTGDHADLAANVAASLGIDRVLAERSPAAKVEAVRDERSQGVVVMVGDGINDAPALATADVGVAMGARGATVSSETADVVLTVDRLDRLVDALAIAKRSRSIAVQSVVAGMSLSVVAMGFAAAGLLTPVVGAFAQEIIDAGVILNAMRALGGGHDSGTRSTGLGNLQVPEEEEDARRLAPR